MKNITLVDFRGWKLGTYTNHSALGPIGLEYVASFAEEAGYNVNILQQRDQTTEVFLDQILSTLPTVIGFSANFTCNVPDTLSLARRIKNYDSNIVTVFGGWHASAMPEELASENCVDYVVIGEGEETFTDLLNCLDGKQDLMTIKGLAYKYNGKVRNTGKRYIEKLDKLPFPIRKKEHLEGNIILPGYPAPSQQRAVAQISYSRGCPFQCTYCTAPTVYQGKTHFRSPSNLVDEIEFLQREFGTNYLFFTDNTFNFNKKKVLELCDEILRSGIDINWFVMCRPNPDEETFTAMRDAGCSRVAFGVESLTAPLLSELNRKHSAEQTKESIQIADSLGMITRGYVITGIPGEERYYRTYEDYLNDGINTLKALANLGLDSIKVSIMTPLPGTSDYFRHKSMIFSDDYKLYDTENPVIMLDYMTPGQEILVRNTLYREFYASEEYRQHIHDKIARFPHLKQTFDEYRTWLNNMDVK